jgi:hypothetical protein
MSDTSDTSDPTNLSGMSHGGIPDDTPIGAHADTDAEQTSKDRSYSPSSERETAEQQASGPGSDIPGVEQLPGTGGPDDSGDTTVPDDDIDPATIVARSHPGEDG